MSDSQPDATQSLPKEKPAYYAIIDADVRYDKTISSTAKLIYAEITALTQKEGYAWASNKYFADNFELSARQVSRCVGELVESGYIDVEITDSYMRKITLKKNVNPLDKNVQGVDKNVQGVGQKRLTPPRQKRLHNNTSINNINNKGDFIDLAGRQVEDLRGKYSPAKEALRERWGKNSQTA